MVIKIYNYKFGNYANKAYRKFNSKEEWLSYMENQVPLHQEGKAQNFNLGDGINTALTFSTINDSVVESANYVMVFKDDGEFHSSWFIASYNYQLGNGYTLALKRDLISAYLHNLSQTRGLIKRGVLPPKQKTPLQFVPELVSTTKVKTHEIELKDEFKDTQWLVSFWSPDLMPEEVSVQISSNVPVANFTVAGIENWPWYEYVGNNTWDSVQMRGNLVLEYLKRDGVDQGTEFRWTVPLDTVLNGGTYNPVVSKTTGPGTIYNDIFTNVKADATVKAGLIAAYEAHRNALKNGLITEFDLNMANEATYAYLQSLSGKIIRDTDTDKFYRVDTEVVSEVENAYRNITVNYGRTAFGSFADYTQDQYLAISNNTGASLQYPVSTAGAMTAITTAVNSKFMVQKSGTTKHGIRLKLVPLPVDDIEFKINNVAKVTNEPFKILAIPFSDSLRVKLPTGGSRALPSKLAYELASALSAKYSQTGLYDIQLLPYAPSSELGMMLVAGQLDYSLYTGSRWVWSDGTDALAVFGITQNNRQFTIPLDEPINVDDYKKDEMFKAYRLVSGSYKSVYDFSAAMNDGIKGFDVDMTLKPLSTFIHVVPWFDWLYGKDFNDLRGLVIAEDISMTQTSDAWETYKLQNMNFENSFNATQDAERSQLALNNKYSDRQLALKMANTAATGVLSTVVSGVVSGGVGAVSSGVKTAVGLATQAIGHSLDKAQAAEQLALSQDVNKRQFEMSLENIKAIPQNLTKTSGFNVLSKYYPILEVYETLDEGKRMVNEYLKLNGFNINAMATLGEFMNVSDDYDYLEFAPYTINVFSNMAINTELIKILSGGIYLCYTEKLPGMEE